MTLIQSRLPVSIDPQALTCTPPSIPIAPAPVATGEDEPPQWRVRRVFFNRLPEMAPSSRRKATSTIEHKPVVAPGSTKSRLWSLTASDAALDVALDRMIDRVLALNAGNLNA